MQKTDAELIAEVEGLVNSALSDVRAALKAKGIVEILSEGEAMAEICEGFQYTYAAELYRELARRLKAANERIKSSVPIAKIRSLEALMLQAAESAYAKKHHSADTINYWLREVEALLSEAERQEFGSDDD